MAKRTRINLALASKSRAEVGRMVDQSSLVIGDLTRGSIGGQEEIGEDEEAEDWFGHQ